LFVLIIWPFFGFETDLSENDNQEALGIEARKNEIKKEASMGIKGKKGSSPRLVSESLVGGERCASANAVFRRISRSVHKC
jgi:hypothetical protein